MFFILFHFNWCQDAVCLHENDVTVVFYYREWHYIPEPSTASITRLLSLLPRSFPKGGHQQLPCSPAPYHCGRKQRSSSPFSQYDRLPSSSDVHPIQNCTVIYRPTPPSLRHPQPVYRSPIMSTHAPLRPLYTADCAASIHSQTKPHVRQLNFSLPLLVRPMSVLQIQWNFPLFTTIALLFHLHVFLLISESLSFTGQTTA